MKAVDRARVGLVAAVATASLALAACPSSLHQSYRSFESAVERGAACDDLLDMRSRLQDPADVERAQSHLSRLGCTSPASVRSDR